LDIRIIAATNRDLAAMVSNGEFREDLWYRLNVFPVLVPPLRRRKEDIPALVHHFLGLKARELKLPYRPRLAPGDLDRLMDHDWPGNVRELKNLIERALILASGQELEIAALLDGPGPVELGPAATAQTENGPFPSLDAVCSQHIRRALRRTQGKISGPGGAAELLALHPNTLRQRMDKLGIAYKKRDRHRH
jgi:DNA-binding NtrC family response regulator